ncbi:MAG: tRNA (N6-threonylcarbamoyladenosine(37)-N6)-methyltransferase TrmO [Desulfuromonadales bacterium]|nr:tRNA (N6-threonylcarbamoyladenosine(37)-N6)-methyltransferase TrmO [Desulfuromonadales bacterium]
MQIRPIGVIHSPFNNIAEMPIQPSGAQGVAGKIEIDSDLVEGLKDLEGFSHIIVLYQFHQVTRTELSVTPFLDATAHGIFATRAPTRPNPIGLSVLALKSISANVLNVGNVDILDGTPLLDIKPYVPEFDHPAEVRIGWLQKSPQGSQTKRSDERFA